MERRYTRADHGDEDVIEPPHDDVIAEERHDDVTSGSVTQRRTAYVADEPAYAETYSERRSGFAFYESATSRVLSVLYALLLALEALLATRFLLLAFGANTANGFVDFILDVSWPFVRPFDGAFANRTWDEGIIEVNTLLAMGVWFVGGMLLAMLINAVMPKTEEVGVTRRRVTHHQ
jgi:hypothetical protein